MANKKHVQELDAWDGTYIEGMTDPELPVIVEAVQEPKEYYHPAMWKDIIATFQCNFCGHCDAVEDEIKLHVLKHVPESEREELFNKLINKE